VSLLAAGGTGAALARWATRPIDDVRRAATQLGAGDLSARAAVDSGPPEVRELAASFNRTAARLEELVTAQEQFVADASHQLRTPLAALRLRIERVQEDSAAQQGLLEELGAGDDHLGRDLAAALDETDRLARLVDGLLLLARAERGDPLAERAPIPLASVLAERRSHWEALAVPREVEIVTEPSDVSVLATRDRLTQILDNLVTNALDASPEGSRIRVSGRAAGGSNAGDAVEIHVVDQGPGMTSADREHAFDRFWRSEREPRSATEALGGSGLGLSIVRKLARADGGEVELRPAPGGGLDAVVVLPAAP
jgi:signal transduction histidine kinase